MNFCSVCGEPLEPNDNYCASCGAAVNKRKGKKTADSSEHGNKLNKSKSAKRANAKTEKSEEIVRPKALSLNKILYVIIALLVIAFAISYIGGVFDSVGVNSGASSNFNEVHKGVDLQKIQQINSLEERVKANPGDTQQVLQLANMLNDSGFKEKAINYYQQYLKSDPKNADVLVDMGVCYYGLGKYGEAVSQMKEALKYQPNHQIANLNLGIVTFAMGKHDEAIDWWKKAVKINPDNEIGQKAQELINQH